MIKLINAAALLAVCSYGKPTLAHGDDKPAYDPSGLPLHGDPTAGGSASKPAVTDDQSEIADKALAATRGVTESGGGTTAGTAELQALLDQSADVKDGTALPKSNIVEIRQKLAQFRYLGDEYARRIDEEINRLEAIILGLDVKKGKK